MQCFFVQIRCALGRAYDVAEALADTELASEIYSTSGDWDLLAKFYVPEDVDIGRFVNANLHGIAGIDRTLTTLTFKAF
ncbi:MAG: Lrp/AsnC ligand binding domain-containing protein [Pseudomonadota bacterium]